jgi:hypothetical protein
LAENHAPTDDPDLHLIVDGEIVRPDPVGAWRYRFDLRAGSTAIWLASRSTVPAEIVVASLDIRRPGAPVEHIVLNDGDLSIEAWHGHARLSEGFHEDEATHRWTVGLARLPESWLRSFPGGRRSTCIWSRPTCAIGCRHRPAASPSPDRRGTGRDWRLADPTIRWRGRGCLLRVGLTSSIDAGPMSVVDATLPLAGASAKDGCPCFEARDLLDLPALRHVEAGARVRINQRQAPGRRARPPDRRKKR